MIGNNRTHIYHRSHDELRHFRSGYLEFYTNRAGSSTNMISPTVSLSGELPRQDLSMKKDLRRTERIPVTQPATPYPVAGSDSDSA